MLRKAAPAQAGEITVALVKVSKKTKHNRLQHSCRCCADPVDQYHQAVLAGGAKTQRERSPQLMLRSQL